MGNAIKSNYILKKILSLLIKYKLFDLIYYNKELQKKLSIDIEDYRKFSGKFLYINNNGHGVEKKIDSNKITFEGEYLNNKKMAKG